MSRKSRSLSNHVTFPPAYAKEGNKLIQVNQPEPVTWVGRQITDSVGHKRSGDGKFHEGGPFFTSLAETLVPTRHVSLEQQKSGTVYVYNGPIATPTPTIIGGPGGFSTKPVNLDKVGAEAISMVEPTNPNASFGVAMGEILKDRKVPIPGISLWRDRTLRAKQAGSEYLNAVFGWLPLISDMQDTAQSIKAGNMIIENYHNASGSYVSRDFVFPDVESSNETVVAGSDVQGPWLPAFSSGQGVITRRETTVLKQWFSGAFTYQAGGSPNSVAKCLGIGSDAEKLFGVSLSPDLIWELTPWSWALDWFSNASNVIHNAQAMVLAGTVMKYGYMMQESIKTITYSMSGSPIRGYPGLVPPPSTIRIITKQRTEANPFGFGIGWEGLSPTQLAITAALGLTRVGK